MKETTRRRERSKEVSKEGTKKGSEGKKAGEGGRREGSWRAVIHQGSLAFLLI